MKVVIMENKKLNRWHYLGILVIICLILSETNKNITNKEIAEKIDFVWKDNGAYIDKIIKKLNDLESKIDDLELALLLKE